jgi:hypothetical protein
MVKKVKGSQKKKAAVKPVKPSPGKTLADHAKEFLREANKILPAGRKLKGIPLRPASQLTHVLRFNMALQNFKETKGLEFDDVPCCDPSRPDDAICICKLNGDKIPTHHTKADCCAKEG